MLMTARLSNTALVPLQRRFPSWVTTQPYSKMAWHLGMDRSQRSRRLFMPSLVSPTAKGMAPTRRSTWMPCRMVTSAATERLWKAQRLPHQSVWQQLQTMTQQRSSMLDLLVSKYMVLTSLCCQRTSMFVLVVLLSVVTVDHDCARRRRPRRATASHGAAGTLSSPRSHQGARGGAAATLRSWPTSGASGRRRCGWCAAGCGRTLDLGRMVMMLPDGREMSGNEFERVAGKASAKKWKARARACMQCPA